MKYLLLIFSVFVLFPLCVYADTLRVSVGQIQESGQTADDEFVEVINNSGYTVDISKWSIQYKSAAGAKYYKKNFPSGATIAAQGHYIVAGSGYTGAYDMKQSTFSLAASGGTIYIVANQTVIDSDSDPDIIAQKTYCAEALAPSNNNQNTPSDVNANSNTNTVLDTGDNSPTGTVVNANTNTATDQNAVNTNADLNSNTNTNTDAAPTATTTDDPADDQNQNSITDTNEETGQPAILPVLINEFMSNPSDTPEWIELYDASDYAVDLTGWHLADGTGKNIFSLSGLIFPRAFMKVELPVARLNNDGDLVMVRDPQDREVDSVAYGDWDSGATNPPAPDENYSLARRTDGLDTNSDLDDFAITTTPTPGVANIITAPPATSGTSLAASSTATKTTKTNLSNTNIQWLKDLFKTQNDQLSELLKANNVVIINNLYIGTDPAPVQSTKTIAAATSTSKKTATLPSTKTTTSAKIATTSKTTNNVSGTVIFPANIVAKDVFVIREADRSVEVRLAANSKLSPVVGDAVTAAGTWSAAKNLPMPKLLVKIDTAMKISAGEPPEERKIAIADADSNLNQVVAAEGVISEKATGKLRISDADASILIKTIFEANKGDRLLVKGLLIKQGNDNVLIPASNTDLSIVKPPEAAKPPTILSRAAPIALAAGPPLILLGAVILGRKLKKKGGEANA